MRILVRRITVKSKGASVHQDEILSGNPLKLGRGTDQQIHLSNLRVALAHAELSLGGDERLRLHSPVASGFRYNGVPTQQAVLVPGDKVELGGFEIDITTAPNVDAMLVISEAATGGNEMEDALRRRSRETLEATGLRMRPWALGLAGTILVLGLLIPLVAAVIKPVGHFLRSVPGLPSDHVWSAGPISHVHAHFVNKCDACHTVPFMPAKNDACLSCHQNTPHHVNAKLLEAGVLKGADCSDCHHEHTGQAAIVRTDDSLCVSCHAKIKSVAPETRLEDVRHFVDGHPQFKPTTVRQVGDRKIEIRVPLDDNKALKEDPNLAFPHSTHLKAEGIRSPSRGKVKLACADCHQTEPGGGLMQPVKFEQQCHECHQLLVPGDIARELPHGNLPIALGALSDYFTAWALRGGYPNEFAPAVVQLRHRPGHELSAQQKQEALAWAKKMTETTASEMLGYTTCGTCHKATPTGKDGAEAWKLAPVNMPHSWLPKSQFNHKRHETQPCADCHAKVEQSETSSDVLLPKIDSCRNCHGGGDAGLGRIPSNCITCHGFHHQADVKFTRSDKPATAALKSAAASPPPADAQPPVKEADAKP